MCLAIPGKIISIAPGANELERAGKVSFAGVVKEASLALVPEAEVGNYVIVHAGLALSVVDEEEAQQTLADLAEMARLADADECPTQE